MTADHTQLQSGDDEQQARELSLRQTRPPAHVPGYNLTRFLGSGAFGEVWIGLDRNTGRQIAAKFYLYRGGVDLSLLSREVEKLVLLSADRYVVQVLDVGWQSDPPYYVMEYIENGSLEQFAQRDESQTIDQLVQLFREIATGLNHSHAKGILHCDLKPGNVLLDQDDQPRLADFGQSRLTHEQTPSLGTLFYMAPEQANLQAVPDASWDVYALGAIFYYLLVGQPPHYNEELLKQIEEAPDLPTRLRCYQQWITTRKPPDEHRKISRVDRTLAGIIDRCLEPHRSKRFPNVQSVLDALRARDQARARRPLLLLGVLGPLMLLALMWFFGGRAADEALQKTRIAVEEKVRQSNRFAAKFVASSVAAEIDRYFRAVEQTATDTELHERLTKAVDQMDAQLSKLADPDQSPREKAERRQDFLYHPLREVLQERINTLYRHKIAPLEGRSPPEIVSLFVCGPRGTHLAGAFPNGSTATVGDNFAFRSYCHGGLRDLKDKDARPLPAQHVQGTSLSSPLLSKVNKRWKVAVSTPLFRHDQPDTLLAILVLTVEVGEVVGDLLEFDAEKFKDAPRLAPNPPGYYPRFAVLVDNRQNNYQGMVLDHPMFRETAAHGQYSLEDELDRNLNRFRISLDEQTHRLVFRNNPFATPGRGKAPERDWISASAPVILQRGKAGTDNSALDSGLVVYVQEDVEYAMTPVKELGKELVDWGVKALVGFLIVVALLWYFVLHVQGGARWWRQPPFGFGSSIASPTPPRSGNTASARTVRRNSASG